MVRIVFAPKAIEAEFVRNVTSYANVLDDIILGPNFDPDADFLVAACKDGDYLIRLGRLRQHLQTLFEFWSKHRGEKWEVPNIIVEEFSFGSCTAMQKLDRCHMFYCHGMCGGPVHAVRSRQTVDLIYRLRERVQYNEISFFGIREGAQIASYTQNDFGVPPLDLLNGIDLHYEQCTGPGAMVPSGTQSKIHMTSGVACLLLLTKDRVVGQSITCIKNHYQWQAFAAQNTQLLQRLADAKAQEWTPYTNPEDLNIWQFNLRGYFHMHSNEFMSSVP